MIRPATSADAAFVFEAARRLASFGPPPWRRAEDIVSAEVRALRAYFEAPPAGARLLVADSDAGSLGFVYLERQQDYFTQAVHAHIGMLVVTEAAAGHGVGSALVKAAEDWAREQGHRTLTLNVFEGNHAARAVYAHLGYAPETLRYVKTL